MKMMSKMPGEEERTGTFREKLPAEFAERMREMLGEEYEAFAASYDAPRRAGLRVNTLKSGWERLEKEPLFGMEPVPWAPHGFYYESGQRPGKHPFHEAGVYYLQEPSAMAVAAFSGVKPGMRVLDLCAAPGGKSTHLASLMAGEGVLYSNEIHPARARILSQNIERMGISRAVVMNEAPERLAERFPVYFDTVVVDAPCSGEGMFRKEEEAIPNWSPANVDLCAARQKKILEAAAEMVAPGGTLVYSTCTFSPQENEENVRWFLGTHPEWEPADLPGLYGSEWMERTGPVPGIGDDPALSGCLRLWPHRLEGEGHFLAVFRKGGTPYEIRRGLVKPLKDREAAKLWKAFTEEALTEKGAARLLPTQGSGMILFGKELYLLPEAVSLEGLKVLRPGLHLGTIKKNRFEPSHALALFLGSEDVRCSAELCGRDGENRDEGPVQAYLRGESLETKDCSSVRGGQGWCLVTDFGFSVGWGKVTGERIKNHYPKGLRRPY